MDDRSVDKETVEQTKGKLMQKAAEKRAEKENSGNENDSGVGRARKRFEENRRLQGVG
jgi:hypothetical protein